MKDQLIGAHKAARLLNLTVQQVRNLCRDRRVPSKRIGKVWVMNEHDVLDYAKEHNYSVAEDHSTYYSRSEVNNTKQLKTLSFFSGAMGLDIGLEQAGYKILLACEIDNACRKTILKNRPKTALLGDIADYTADEIRRRAGLTPHDEIDLIVGGPPCQSFSTAGKRKGFNDERGNVLLTFLDRIISLRPRFAVIENVRGILSAPLSHRPHDQRGLGHPPLSPNEMEGGALMHVLLRLRRAGYGVSFNLYNAANFGTPQKRERVIIICSRDGAILPYLTPTHSENGDFGLPKWRTFGEAVKGLHDKGHHYLNFPEKRLKYYRMLGPGQYWKNLPKELQRQALGASYYSGGGKTGFLRRLSWDAPSPTLVTHPAMPATDLAHPVLDRPLSIEEYKRVQEFPDDWGIEGSLLDQYRQVGNAVPISLGRAVGRLILSHIFEKKVKVPANFPYSRYKSTDHVGWERVFRLRNKPELALA